MVHNMDGGNKGPAESQLILTVHVDSLVMGLDKKGQVDAMLLNFFKVVDKVHHHRLHLTLEFYGVWVGLLNGSAVL